MKKTILSVMGLMAGAYAVAQNPAINNNTVNAMHYNQHLGLTMSSTPTVSGTAVNANRAANSGVTYFTETWGNGFAGDGTNGAWTNYGEVNNVADADAIWEYRGPSTTPDNTEGSRGAYDAGNPIISPTAGNGFVIFDSDYLDNGGVQGNFGMGDAPTPHKSWLESPTFSTAGSSSISINFNTYFRRFLGTAYILLSNDNGVTWGDSVTIMDADWPVNDASTLDLVINQDISYIANTSQAKIALFFDGQTEANANGSGYYHVQVDDITIADTPDNNLSLDQVYFNNPIDTGSFGYYSQVPSMLATFDTVVFSADISNQGAADQNNVQFVNNIISPAGTSSLASPAMTLVAGASDSVAMPGYVLDQGVGTYAWAFSVESDSVDDVPSNNTIDTVFVNVTDTTYARDRGASGNLWYGAGNSYEIGVRYDIYDTVKLTSITIAVGDQSTVGEAYSVYLYDDQLDVPVASREFLDIAAGEPGTLMSVDMPETILEPGVYYATFAVYSDQIFFPSSNYEPVNDQAIINVNAGGWGTTNGVAVIRMNVSDDLFVCDLTATTSQTAAGEATVVAADGTAPYTYAWSNGETTDVVTGLAAGNYMVTVTDAAGCETVNSVDIVCQVTVTVSQTGTDPVEGTAVGANGVEPYTYEWNTGDTGPVISGVPSGVYTVTITDATGCTATADELLTEVSVAELGGNGTVTAFPNPSNGDFNVSLQNVENGAYQISVMNMVGQTINVRTVNVSGNQVINLGDLNLTEGMYFVEVSNQNNEKSVLRVIVK